MKEDREVSLHKNRCVQLLELSSRENVAFKSLVVSYMAEVQFAQLVKLVNDVFIWDFRLPNYRWPLNHIRTSRILTSQVLFLRWL